MNKKIIKTHLIFAKKHLNDPKDFGKSAVIPLIKLMSYHCQTHLPLLSNSNKKKVLKWTSQSPALNHIVIL